MTSGKWNMDAVRAITAIAVLLALFGLRRAEVLHGPARRHLDAAAYAGLNDLGLDQKTQNYYQGLMDNTDLDAEVMVKGGLAAAIISKWISPAALKERLRTTTIVGSGAGAIAPPPAFIGPNITPNVNVIYTGIPFQSNRWGHRDDDCEKEKPRGTFRIGLAGGSNEMGNGVERPNIYADFLEKMLNERLGARNGQEGHEHYEVLNFGMTAYGMLERVYTVTERMPEFQPDLVLISVTVYDLGWLVYDHAADKIFERRDLHYDFLKQIADRARATPADGLKLLKMKMKRFRTPLLEGCFEELRTFSDRTGIPVAVLVLRLSVSQVHANLLWEARAVERHGLIPLRIFDAYEGQDPDLIYLDPMRDHHPTPLGHRRIAEEIYAKMMAEPRLRPLLLGESKGGRLAP